MTGVQTCALPICSAVQRLKGKHGPAGGGGSWTRETAVLFHEKPPHGVGLADSEAGRILCGDGAARLAAGDGRGAADSGGGGLGFCLFNLKSVLLLNGTLHISFCRAFCHILSLIVKFFTFAQTHLHFNLSLIHISNCLQQLYDIEEHFRKNILVKSVLSRIIVVRQIQSKFFHLQLLLPQYAIK